MSREWHRSDSVAPARANLLGRAPGSNPYLFVAGAARSGTTLLQRTPGAHPLLAEVNKTYWLPRQYRERTGLTRDGLVTSALLLLLGSEKFERMGFGEEDLQRIADDSAPVRCVGYVGVAVGELPGEFGYAPGARPRSSGNPRARRRSSLGVHREPARRRPAPCAELVT